MCFDVISAECFFGSYAMSRHTLSLLTAILCCGAAVSSAGQSKSANAASQGSSSLGETLRNSMGKEIHIFYVHGIGSYGPNDRDSLAMRKNICDYLKDCTAPYAVHFQLARSSGQTLYVDEINWWPLTFSLKCRQFVASDASFVARNKL